MRPATYKSEQIIAARLILQAERRVTEVTRSAGEQTPQAKRELARNKPRGKSFRIDWNKFRRGLMRVQKN